MKQIFGTKLTEYLPALGLFAGTVIYLVTAYGYTPDARAVPAGVAWAMLLFLALDLVSRAKTPLGKNLMLWLNPAGDEERPDYSGLKQLNAVLWVAGLTASMVAIGILYTVPLFVFVSLLLRGRRPLWLSAMLAAFACLTIWVLFVYVLKIELYPGLLFGGA